MANEIYRTMRRGVWSSPTFQPH